MAGDLRQRFPPAGLTRATAASVAAAVDACARAPAGNSTTRRPADGTFHFDNAAGESTVFFDRMPSDPRRSTTRAYAFTDWLAYDVDVPAADEPPCAT